jgi:pyruvate dehydrogenase kinase 2/3/4
MNFWTDFIFAVSTIVDDSSIQQREKSSKDKSSDLAFFVSGIGIRVLIGQYLSLRQPPVENYVGVICSVTSPYEIVKRAIDDAAFMCTRKYGDAPEVIMSGRLDLTFPYVPTHLRKYKRGSSLEAESLI